MIIVEIEVPMLGKSYDFQVEEDVPLYEVKEEITEMICRKEQCFLAGEEQKLLLWNMQNGQRLALERTAGGNNLVTGSQLLLV